VSIEETTSVGSAIVILQQLEKDGNGNPRVGRLLVERVGFRMPTESEWEVGGRAGQRTAYTFGSDVSLLSTHGWFMDNSTGKRPQVSAAKPPGVGGLHDMQGNLLEWVHDWYVISSKGQRYS
jgi:formylglycine-generating enzyme required for sulfatase activity